MFCLSWRLEAAGILKSSLISYRGNIIMKKTLLTAAVLAFGISPVMAQTSDSGTSSPDAATSDSAAATSGDSTSSSMSTEDMVASQEKVLGALEKAGYEDASIMDAAYMVQAKTPDGEQVLMMIDTSGRVMGAQKAPSAGSTASPHSGNSNSGATSGSNDNSTTEPSN
ncbi:hypothetical protein U0C82_16840 [Fulvimarina sp. 2208YS6-2-32]|uniref:PepSY domain-containing protein n=1 Tax=Fulvimarina uroteuthidis TaxID=3098149 RepID=A0ABU5I606_9HYPH|nr:hypothetical protein [Fulvimarina sp. 2208YS6-2-32]MDY8110809.1 hypothetical protein [Fulvimarina sp. 2208YS6-2-32]